MNIFLERIANVLRGEKTLSYLLLVVILYASLVRFMGIPFGLPYLHNWDEPQSASTALRILKTGDYNPHFFNYPSFTIYSNLLVDIVHYYYLMGQDESAFDYLRNINEIIINKDTGWQWTVSHPSFYLWNRALIAILGIACVFITYRILKENYGETEGLFGAFFLAGFSYHITHSRYITPDIPMCFFLLLVLLFSLRFHSSHKIRDLVISSLFVGFAISCKYNAILSLAIPMSACLLNVKHIKLKRNVVFLLIFILPFFVFFAMNPFVLIDLRTFLAHSGWEVFHYKVRGHLGASSAPGFKHFMYQMTRISNEISKLLFYLAFAGIFVSLRKRKLLFIMLIFPVIYIYLMVQQKVNFHRNFVVMYPFFAIFAAVAVAFLSMGFSRFSSLLQVRRFRRIKCLKGIMGVIPFLIVAVMVSDKYIWEFKKALHIWRTPETRTQAIDFLNATVDDEKSSEVIVGIAKELRIHRLDLKKLKMRHEIFEHQYINSFLRKCDYLLVGEYGSWKEELHKEDEELNKIVPKDRVYKIINGGKTRRDVLSIDPKILILEGYR